MAANGCELPLCEVLEVIEDAEGVTVGELEPQIGIDGWKQHLSVAVQCCPEGGENKADDPKGVTIKK